MPYNKEEQAFIAIKNKIESAMAVGQRLEYVKYLQMGNHREILTTQLPAIIIHPRRIMEEWHAMARQKKATFEFEIRGILAVANRMNGIYNTADGPGILTLDADIKDVLETDLSEAGTTLRPDIQTEGIVTIGEKTLHTVISVKLFLTLFLAGQRG